jgi:predicted helicase
VRISRNNRVSTDDVSRQADAAVQLALPLVSRDVETLFREHTPGFQASRETWPPDFDAIRLVKRVAESQQVTPRQRNAMAAIRNATRSVLYRPFSKQWVYLEPQAESRAGLWSQVFPTPLSELENRVIWLKIGSNWPLFALMADRISGTLPQGGAFGFPFYVYAEDGSDRQENITDWALSQFQTHYSDTAIGKWDIFYYVYGLLHHPGYREKYADSLKRELPRIPFAPDFWAFSESGFQLAELHLYYDAPHIVQPYPLNYQWTPGKRPDWRVEKMRLSKDKTTLLANDTLTLAGIPPEADAYRLGNRSALEWVIDQYRVKQDKRSGIISDPNRADDEQAIVDLVRQVVAVSVETARIVAALPPFE